MVGFEVGFSMFQNVCSPEAKKVGRDWHGRVVTQAGLERKRDFLVAGVVLEVPLTNIQTEFQQIYNQCHDPSGL